MKIAGSNPAPPVYGGVEKRLSHHFWTKNSASFKPLGKQVFKSKPKQ